MEVIGLLLSEVTRAFLSVFDWIRAVAHALMRKHAAERFWRRLDKQARREEERRARELRRLQKKYRKTSNSRSRFH